MCFFGLGDEIPVCSLNIYFICILGRDNNIRIYDLENVSQDSASEPLFIHDGHLAELEGGDTPTVTCHSWNDCGEPRILSATDTGQLHTWMFSVSSLTQSSNR